METGSPSTQSTNFQQLNFEACCLGGEVCRVLQDVPFAAAANKVIPMEEVIQVAVREGRGSQAAKRLRQQGQIPAILYGHGEENVALSVPASAFQAALRHGSRIIDLEGGVKEKAFIRDVQWDTYGIDVLHIDFTRVSAGEKVTATLAIELRGEAPGAKEGGMVEVLVHEVEVELPASEMVDHLDLNVSELHLNDSLTAASLILPTGATVSDPDTVLVHCVPPKGAAPAAEPTEGGEPEVIGQENDGEE